MIELGRKQPILLFSNSSKPDQSQQPSLLASVREI
jgi:hypothetical protein